MVFYKEGYKIFDIELLNIKIYSLLTDISDRERYKRINRRSYLLNKKQDEYMFYCYQPSDNIEYSYLRYDKIYYEYLKEWEIKTDATEYMIQFRDGISSRLYRRIEDCVNMYYCINYFILYMEERRYVEKIIGTKISDRRSSVVRYKNRF
jgi:hypothetical protein